MAAATSGGNERRRSLALNHVGFKNHVVNHYYLLTCLNRSSRSLFASESSPVASSELYISFSRHSISSEDV